MKENTEMEVVGIKCDAPDCDFTNMDVQITEYKNWLNAPCPKCGASLLTEADYKAVMKMMNMVNFINRFPILNRGPKVKVRAEMNGTGKVKVRKL